MTDPDLCGCQHARSEHLTVIYDERLRQYVRECNKCECPMFEEAGA